MVQLIPEASLPVSRWANGAGRKADIASRDGWMAGFAWLDADAPFSDLAGFDRTIMLVQGPGFTLEIAGRPPLVVAQPFTPGAFDGGAATVCRVMGPCRVLNVMTARGRFHHDLQVMGPGSAMLAGEVASLAVMLRGHGTVDGMALGTLDAALIGQADALEGTTQTLAASIAIGVSSA